MLCPINVQMSICKEIYRQCKKIYRVFACQLLKRVCNRKPQNAMARKRLIQHDKQTNKQINIDLRDIKNKVNNALTQASKLKRITSMRETMVDTSYILWHFVHFDS